MIRFEHVERIGFLRGHVGHSCGVRLRRLCAFRSLSKAGATFDQITMPRHLHVPPRGQELPHIQTRKTVVDQKQHAAIVRSANHAPGRLHDLLQTGKQNAYA